MTESEENTEAVGLIGGMFFEYYLFDPVSNFIAEDLVVLLKFFDVEFDSEDSIPKNSIRHFENRVFVPKDDITVGEFVDILDAMNISLNDEKTLKQLPESMQEHFEGNVFRPYVDFGLEELKIFLSQVVALRLDSKQFETLTPHMKRQFLVQNRSSEKPLRWGTRGSA